ncbi:SDR family oxidoreductase [Brevundimonas sp.]|jgi:3-oxoacyl-[acyl-carrier protein] reductase|uniref:SDR family oxidoreductase n=1 Tax=Brevundimonas sp. TaxID=1871086 RepID=UPI00378361FA
MMGRDSARLDGETALIISLGLPMLAGIAEGLTARGATVVTLEHPALGMSVDAVEAALIAGLGETMPTLVVLSLLTPQATAIASLEGTNLETWKQAASDPIRIAMRVLTALGRRMKPSGRGAVVFVAPSLSLVGGAGLVGLSTALEGQRGLMKSTARQWGASGVTVNWLAAAPRGLSDHFEGADLASKGDAVPVALGRRPSADEIAGMAAWLAGPAGRSVTGATLLIDGGEWMVP